jgi:hypothetical protein
VYRDNHSRLGIAGSGEMDGVLLVAAWFSRHKQELQKTLEPHQILDRNSLGSPLPEK